MESFNNKREEQVAPQHDALLSSTQERRPERIWAELNLEKWPAIWQPAHANTKLETRHIEREIELPNGKRITAKVKVGFTDEGSLTTEDRKTYYALIEQWQENDNPTEHIPVSIRKLAKLLQKDGWGTNVIDSITHSLKKLRVTPFTWTNSYKDGATGEVVEEIELFSILSELKVIRRKQDGHITYQGGYYRFNDFLMRNLLARHTKPVLFDTILKLQSDIAQLLYSHVDLMLHDKRQYERRTNELFADLGLTGAAYKNLSNRKQKLLRALKELRGVRLTSGRLSDATLERTKDGKDYKVIFKKAAASSNATISSHTSESGRAEKHVYRAEEPDDITRAAADLVRYFYRTFHSVEHHNPQRKELDQAISLIATHGIKQANYVVKFSHDAVEQTHFKPATFGGILHYTSRAVTQYEKKCRAERRTQDGIAEQVAERERQLLRDQERNAILQSLTPQDYEERFRYAKTELFKNSPLLATTESSFLTQTIIRSSMLDRLERERLMTDSKELSLVRIPNNLLPPPSAN